MKEKKSSLSAEMVAAIDYASENGNKLIRHQGGFWSNANWGRHQESYGTATVEALVKRGVMTYTMHKDTIAHPRKFPIEATLTAEYSK